MTKTFNLSGLIRTKSVLISIMALAIVVSLFAFAVNTADAQAGPFSHWGFNEGSGTNAHNY